MDEEIKIILKEGIKPTLLLHACCAPCSTSVLEKLSEFFEITIFFYNPNISPESEFSFRLDELKRLLTQLGMPDIKIISPEYDSKEFDDIVYHSVKGQNKLQCFQNTTIKILFCAFVKQEICD